MGIIAVGSLAFDSLKTAAGERERVIGGSLTHFANAARFLSKPKLVGIVGNDFSVKEWDFIRSCSTSVDGVETLKDEKSFFWKGYYTEDFDTAHTVTTELNAFAKFNPKVPETYKKGGNYLFLANIGPAIQLKVAQDCPGSILKVLDTMNYWITSFRDQLEAAFSAVDGIVINEGEAFLLTGEKNILKAVEKLWKPNYRFVIVKKGSNGVMVFGGNFIVTLPAYPLKEIIDPTGAGDSFAGAFMSWLDKNNIQDLNPVSMRKAAAYATVVASFAVEGFGVEGISSRSEKDVQKRLKDFESMASF